MGMSEPANVAVPLAGRLSAEKVHGRVLVVDDERPNRAVLVKLLTAMGCEAIEAATGEAGLEAARRHAPDLALVDIMMPGLSGYEVCSQLRSDPATSIIPVILVTARREVEDVEHGFDLGAFDYIRKPFNARELVARVRNALALKHSSDEMRLRQERMSRELELAGSLQRKLFATDPIFIGDFEVHVAYQPTLTVGGDLFEVIPLPGNSFCIYVGDVAGHGVAPALVSTLLKAVISEVACEFAAAGPADVCRQIDQRFRRHVTNPAIYATLFLAIFDSRRSVWACMNCGHPDPILTLSDGHDASAGLKGRGSLPIGFAASLPDDITPDASVEAPAPPGSSLCLFTDGILEARLAGTGEPCGTEGLEQAVHRLLREEPAFNPAGRVVEILRESGYELNRDDCVLLMAQRKEPATLRLDTELPVDVSSVAKAAAQAEEKLLAEGWLPEEAVKVRLAIMEHGTNVVKHGRATAGSRIRITMRMEGSSCRVLMRDRGREWDFAASLAAQQGEPVDRESKRGLALIRAVTTQAGFFRQDEENRAYLAFSRKLGTVRRKEAD
jgi:DNA-binding response OmpR family regulator/anti-sigma regulatory factor (Ser/Thr protein kinase)